MRIKPDSHVLNHIVDQALVSQKRPEYQRIISELPTTSKPLVDRASRQYLPTGFVTPNRSVGNRRRDLEKARHHNEAMVDDVRASLNPGSEVLPLLSTRTGGRSHLELYRKNIWLLRDHRRQSQSKHRVKRGRRSAPRTLGAESHPANSLSAATISHRNTTASSAGALSSIFDRGHQTQTADTNTLPSSRQKVEVEVATHAHVYEQQQDASARREVDLEPLPIVTQASDSRTEYSLKSTADDPLLIYIQEFSEQLLSDLRRLTQHSPVAEVPGYYLDEALKDFGLILHEESSNSLQWDASVTLYRKRRQVEHFP